MKLRIRDDSVRLRLTRGEVASLVEGGRVDAEVRFGPAPGERLSYSIVLGGTSLVARFSDGRIEVSVPEASARSWASSDVVGFEHVQEVGGGRTLRILVEKDFACLTTRPHEDDADAFPNPKASC